MPILMLIGAAMVAGSVTGIIYTHPTNTLKRTIYRVIEARKLKGIKLRKVVVQPYGYDVDVEMPHGVTIEEFREKCLESIEQATFSKAQVAQDAGYKAKIRLGTKPFDQILYDEALQTEPLQYAFATPFGIKFLSLLDDSSCHIMGGGATRMGKTSLINMLIIHGIRSTFGQIEITAISSKITDFHMYHCIPQVRLAETPSETVCRLEAIVDEMLRRKNLLKSKGDVKDIHSFRYKYDHYLPPVLVIVDELGAFSNKKDKTCEHIHKLLTEIAERAGYLDIHLIAFSQRVDVTDVFPPRMKNNMLTKIAFTTTDENNSKLIINSPDAAYLGAKKGRAILVDGMPELVQVPYISEEAAVRLLEPYRKDDLRHDEPRQIDTETSETFPSFVTGSVGSVDMPGSEPTGSDGEPGHEEIKPRRTRSSNRKAKG